MDFLNFRLYFPTALGLMALGYLYIALRGFITRKPFLISTRWLFLFILPIFVPSLFIPFELHNRSVNLGLVVWISPLVCILFLWYFWKVCNGYTVYGVTDESFRKSLLLALEKSKLKFDENLNGIYLKSYDVTLKAAVFWMGMGYIRLKGKVKGNWLPKVIQTMAQELNKPKTEVDLKPFFFYLAFAVLFLILTGAEISLFCQMGKL